MSAIVAAAHAIAAGDGTTFVAGGTESMTRAPMVMAKPSAAFPRGEQTVYDTTLGWRFTNPRLAEAHYPYSMGETAENVVEKVGVSREDQDRFALASHQRWAAAQEAGRFADEVIPMTVPGPKKGETATVERDEHPRPDTTLEQLAGLKPAFRTDESGSVTAGNSSGINDGAAAVVVMSEQRARETGCQADAPDALVGRGRRGPGDHGPGPHPCLPPRARASGPIGQ